MKNKYREEARKLYEGKFFYEVLKNTQTPDQVILVGPIDDILYVNKNIDRPHNYSKYEFVQIINGTPVVAFTKDEILVLDRKL